MTRRPIRVAHCLEELYSGGVEQRRLHLARHLPSDEFRQLVICTEAKGPIADDIRAAGAEIVETGPVRSLLDPARYRRVAAALAGALRALAHAPARRRPLGEAGRARADALFSAERYAQDVAGLYRELIAEGGPLQGGAPAPRARPSWMPSPSVPGLVSVIVPLYNRADLIRSAVESVRRQPYRPVELIVVDDGSTDDGADRVEAWAVDVTSPSFDVQVIRQANGGAPTARNAGLQASQGEFIQFLDSDDLLTPAKLPAQVEALRTDPALDYVWSHSTHQPTPEMPSAGLAGPGAAAEVFRGDGRVAAPMQVVHGLYRRHVCAAVGPWTPGLPRYQDWEYNVRALSVCRAVACVDVLGYIVVEHDRGRISTTSRRTYAAQIRRAVQSLDTYRDRLDPYLWRYLSAQALSGAAMLLALEGDYVGARTAARHAARRAPVSSFKLKAQGFAALAAMAPSAARYIARRLSSVRT
ncbi:glycosyltransferase [Rubrivirga sp. IMCC45206]|uniref:glycosyltransferase n=1 Tax=Rubrivirga sp. IMCC45206 TaxID=3391614 RepID=UPI0039900AB3